jgi:hypothetical protein
LFAPGWTFEVEGAAGPGSFELAERRLWDGAACEEAAGCNDWTATESDPDRTREAADILTGRAGFCQVISLQNRISAHLLAGLPDIVVLQQFRGHLLRCCQTC